MKPQTAIQYLRDRGRKVRVRHLRRFQTPSGERLLTTLDARREPWHDGATQPLPRGGQTEVLVYNGTPPEGGGQPEFKAVAECSEKDGFNKKIGLRIAVGRIVKDMGIKDELRLAEV